MNTLVSVVELFDLKSLNDHAAVEQKLRQGFEVNTTDSGGRTLLMEAVIQADHRLAELLVEKGADVNIHDNRGWTALHFAAQRFDVLSAELLIRKGADVNAQDRFGNNVIARAVADSRGRGDVIELLLKNGADATVKNQSGISALDTARSISNYNVIQFFE